MPNERETKTGNRLDPYSVYNFELEMEGIIRGGFTEVSGLSIQTDVESRKEGGVNDFEYKLPKSTKYSDITLKRGLIDWELWDWYQNVIKGIIKRISGTIYLRDHSRNRIIGWHFYEAYPIKWEGSSFNASSNTVASETFVLTHHGLQKR